jgi:hypothetical protein
MNTMAVDEDMAGGGGWKFRRPARGLDGSELLRARLDIEMRHTAQRVQPS